MITNVEDLILDTIRETLRDNYGILGADSIERLPIGQGTINYCVRTSAERFFLKRYIGHENLNAEEAAIGLSEIAGDAGVLTARVIPNISGQWIDKSSGIPFSLWAWVDGAVLTDNLSLTQYAEVGAVLGRIHRTFAGLPHSNLSSGKAEQWMKITTKGVLSTVENILTAIHEKQRAGLGDPFDDQSIVDLHERKDQLNQHAALMADLPELGTQILHGDYTFVNMLFMKERIAAVLDFRPPELFLRSYDLGRIAFYPNTVAKNENWLAAAMALVSAYKEENPCAPNTDIVFCGRVALLQLLKSLYGVKQHYLAPGLIQEDLDEFWALRHQTVGKMLYQINEVENMLRSV